MGERSAEQPLSLAELDARHDELLCQLEDLDQRIQTVLKEHLPQKTANSILALDGNEPAPPLAPSFGEPLVTFDDPGVPTY